MSLELDLVAQLRRRLKDERAGRAAFRLVCTDTSATDCMVTIDRAGVLKTTAINARVARSLTLDLVNDPQFNTIRQVLEYFKAQPGYDAVVERDIEANHPAADIMAFGTASCLGTAVDMRHRIWSDDELEELLRSACIRHNVRYTPATVPPAEQVFVLMLAHAEAFRQLAGDAAKRSGVDYSVEDLLYTASELELAYRQDVKRQARALPVPAPMDEADRGRGEIITSNAYRRSNRTGWMVPIGAALEPIAVELRVDDIDVEDTKVTLRWTRNRDMQFYAYEIWRDTRPGVERPPDVSVVTDVPDVLHDTTKRVYTAKLAFRSAGPHSVRERVGTIAILSEQGGQTINAFTDVGYTQQNPRNLGPATAPPLEPGTTYYYRMFVIGLNDVFSGSNEVCVTTKSQRPLFASQGACTPTQGPVGTVVTLTGTGFTSGMKATFNGKAVTLTFVSSTTVTFVVPNWSNLANMIGLRYDVVIEDPVTGLLDVLLNAFKLIAS